MKTVSPQPRWMWDDRLELPRGSVERVVHGSEAWRQAQTGQLPVDAYWQAVARELRLDDAGVAALQHDYFSGDRLDPQLVAYLRTRRAEGFQVALLSNDSPELAAKLRTLEIDDVFEPLIISADIGVMKPDARAYQITLERLGRTAGETIFVDDMPANIAAAAALGIHAVHYTAGMALTSALEPLLYVQP